MNKTKLKGNFILLLTAIIWGISFVSQREGMEYIEPNTFNGIRTWLGCAVLLPFVFLRERKKSAEEKAIEKKNKKALLISGIICGCLLCTATTLQTYGMADRLLQGFGLHGTTAGKSGFITAMYMILVPFLGLFFKKRPSWIAVLSAFVALGGLSLLCLTGEETGSLNFGDFLTMLCAIIFALHILAIDHFSPSVDGVKLSCLQFFVSGAINIVLMFVFEKPQISLILQCSTAILYSGIMSCGVAYTLQVVGQRYTDPASASILMSLESVFAVLAGTILLQERMTPWEVLGCILMFAAILLVQLPDILAAKKR